MNNHEKGTILIVDESMDVCKFIKSIADDLSLFNNVILAHNCADEEIKISDQKCDVLIIDSNIPVKTGLEIVENLITTKILCKNKIIFISGFADSDEVFNVFKTGIKNILIKPFKHAELKRLITRSFSSL